MDFAVCCVYLLLVGLLAFWGGRMLTGVHFCAEAFPFRPFAWERDGKLYRRLRVQRWQAHLPDMSRILPGTMPPKRLAKGTGAAQLERLVQETCIAEVTHTLLCVLGCGCALLWRGGGGAVMALVYAAGNVPFLIAQRYNRPRLVRLARRAAAGRGAPEEVYAAADPDAGERGRAK